MERFKKALGFTLVELMIVITIIGILLALFMGTQNSEKKANPDRSVSRFLD